MSCDNNCYITYVKTTAINTFIQHTYSHINTLLVKNSVIQAEHQKPYETR